MLFFNLNKNNGTKFCWVILFRGMYEDGEAVSKNIKVFFTIDLKVVISLAFIHKLSGSNWLIALTENKKNRAKKIIFFKTVALLSNLHKFAETAYLIYSSA